MASCWMPWNEISFMLREDFYNEKIVAITLALLVLAGCSSETYTSGLGMVNSIGSSKSATEEAAGLAQADVPQLL